MKSFTNALLVGSLATASAFIQSANWVSNGVSSSRVSSRCNLEMRTKAKRDEPKRPPNGRPKGPQKFYRKYQVAEWLKDLPEGGDTFLEWDHKGEPQIFTPDGRVWGLKEFQQRNPGEGSLTASADGKKTVEPTGLFTLYAKAGNDGVSRGDCPFAQYVELALAFKGIKYSLKPSTQDTKPEWLLENYDGKLPCLVHDEEAYTESQDIVDYLDYFFAPSLAAEDDSHLDVMKATSGFFPAVAKFIKNKDTSADEELKANVVSELQVLEKALADKQSTGPFFGGKDVNMADISLAPKFYHLKVAAAHFKNMVIPAEFSATIEWFNAISDLQIWKDSVYTPDAVTYGWDQARA